MYVVLSMILGYLFTLCFAPYYYLPLGFLSITGLLILIDIAKSNSRAFFYAFAFAFGHHVTGLYWISNSLLVDADRFAWLIPFAISLIPAYLSIYIGSISYCTKRLKYKGLAKIFFFSGIWVMAEIIRSKAFTGFPWNLGGYIFLKSPEFSQAASYIGVYGLSLMALLLFSAPYYVYYSISEAIKNNKVIVRASISITYLLPLSILFIFVSYWGGQRITNFKDRFEETKVRIVQPNISQRDKFDPRMIGDNIYKYISLSVSKSQKGTNYVPDLIIWPEAAIPLNLSKEKDFVNSLQDIIPYGSNLIMGTIRTTDEKSYNSIQIVDSEGVLQDDYYDKFHLVPFGEYIPLRKYFPFVVSSIANGIGDFGTGYGTVNMQLSNSGVFSPLICYEIVFPGNVINKEKSFYERAKWILNVTNDSWFGLTSGPYQHLDKARMRAIEEGVPVVRAAGTGISAIIDSYGRVLKKLDMKVAGVIDSKVPSAHTKENFYSIYGNKVPILLASIMLFLAAMIKFSKRNT